MNRPYDHPTTEEHAAAQAAERAYYAELDRAEAYASWISEQAALAGNDETEDVEQED